MKRSIIVVFAALVALVLFHATTANATDRPYTVTSEGVELTEGTFQANGHINWRTTAAEGSMHFDPNNGQPGGTYIGASFFPIPLAPGECIVWVQVHPFNYHFGEHGEEPVCASTTVPTSSPTPPVEPTPTSTPSVNPSPSPEPSMTPSPTSTPEPSTAPTPSAPPVPSPSPSEEDEPTASPSTGIGSPAFPEATVTPEPSSTTSPVPSTSVGSDGSRGMLPVTGSVDVGKVLFVVVAMVLIGAAALWAERRKPRS